MYGCDELDYLPMTKLLFKYVTNIDTVSVAV
jgi:hypothetical protein